MQEVRIKTYHGYSVTDDGRVFGRYGRQLKPIPNAKGYLRVMLTIDGEGRWHRVHRLVAELFISNPEPDTYTQIDHISGNRQDNRACNLRWVTDRQNKQAKYNLRRLLGQPTLTKAEDIAIRKARASRRCYQQKVA